MPFIRIYMPNGGEDGVIIANFNDDKRIEFRGNPYSQWDESESSPMFKIHSMIKKANISNLHADGVETITPWHSEWLEVYQMILDS